MSKSLLSGYNVKISPLCDIESSIRGNHIKVGNNTIIDSFCKFKFAGGNGDIVIGQNCYINSFCMFYSGNGITIKDNVLLAAHVILAPANHNYIRKNFLIKDQGFLPSKNGIFIDDDVWIGANSVILDGAYISKGCVIGALSLVNQMLPPYSVCAGNPLKIFKYRI